MRTLREGYMPGDLNWDPLGMKPKSEAELLRARQERRVMTEIMGEQESSEEEILRRQLRRLRGQDIQDLRDMFS